MKKLLLVGVVGAILFFVMHDSNMSELMDIDEPLVASENSGEFFIEPGRGDVIEMDDYVKQGLITVIHINDKSCDRCRYLNKFITQHLKFRPDIAVVQIPAPGVAGYSPEYRGKPMHVDFVPYILIFDREGNLMASDEKDNAGEDLLRDWINEEVARQNKMLRS